MAVYFRHAPAEWTEARPVLSETFEPPPRRKLGGSCHTNGLENYWSLLKRCIKGTYVSVEPFHLFRYLDEQAFRYNQRKNADGTIRTDGKRFEDVMGMIAGKRLTYNNLTGNAPVLPPQL